MHPSESRAQGKGILLYLAGVCFFAANDALGKYLVTDYGVGELLMLRSLGAAVVLVILARLTGTKLAVSGQWTLQIVRILCMAGDSFCFYRATRDLPLADVMTFYMAGPLVITAFSQLLLGERVGIYRWSAIFVGFIGVLVALQPTHLSLSPASGIALFGAILFGLSIVITRKLREAHWMPLVTWQFIGAALIGAAATPFDWVTPGAVDLGLMFLVGIFSSVCFVLITKAVALAPTSLLAPFQYSAILWAALWGWVFWGDTPTTVILIGNAIIIGSGLFIFYREHRLRISVSSRIEPIP